MQDSFTKPSHVVNQVSKTHVCDKSQTFLNHACKETPSSSCDMSSFIRSHGLTLGLLVSNACSNAKCIRLLHFLKADHA